MRSAVPNALVQVLVVAVMTVFMLILSAIVLPPKGGNAMPLETQSSALSAFPQ